MTELIESETSNVELTVQGMTCGSCQRRVRDALAAVPGATEVEVSLRQRSATVRLATSVPDVEALVDAVRRAGYDATVSRVSGAAVAPPLTARAEARCSCCERHP